MLQKLSNFVSQIWNPLTPWGEIDHDKLMLAFVRVIMISVVVSVVSLIVEIVF